MSTIYDWSLTDSENGGADDLINWSEGQAPNTVNNSARVMMQRVREYLSDIGGAVTSTFKVYPEQQKIELYLNSHTGFSKYQTGILLRFNSPCTTIGATTVSLNGLASKPIYKATETGLVQLTGGEIQQGCLYSLVYDEEISGWQLLNPTIQKSTSLKRLPSGLIGPFAMQSLPSGWLVCDGRAYLREDYRDLFLTIGTVWGEGDGVSTFNVPDLRGVFLRGLDDGRAVDPWRSFASLQGFCLKSHDHFISPSSSQRPSRQKREVSSSESSLKREKRGDDVCAGLDGDSSALCEVFSDEIMDFLKPHKAPFWFTEKDKPAARLPWFIRSPFANFLSYSTPITEGLEDRAHHEHHLLAESYGGAETRPINVSVVFGIKT